MNIWWKFSKARREKRKNMDKVLVTEEKFCKNWHSLSFGNMDFEKIIELADWQQRTGQYWLNFVFTGPSTSAQRRRALTCPARAAARARRRTARARRGAAAAARRAARPRRGTARPRGPATRPGRCWCPCALRARTSSLPIVRLFAHLQLRALQLLARSINVEVLSAMGTKINYCYSLWNYNLLGEIFSDIVSLLGNYIINKKS